MKRLARLIGASALFLMMRENIASANTNIPSSNPGPSSVPFNTASEVVDKSVDLKNPEKASEKRSSLTTHIDSQSSPVQKKKRQRKATATTKKPTNSKPTNSKPAKASSPQTSSSLRRIKNEYEDAVKMGICYDWARQRLVRSKSAGSSGQEHRGLICLGPLASNLRYWHFSFRGCGVYENGIYHGRIQLPKDYPSTPPQVQLWTPSGRFIPYHNICLSASSYHPESWTPRWTVLSLVQALRLHMLTNPQEIGAKVSSYEEKLEYARQSLSWKLRFRAGKLVIDVDHALLLSQRALFLGESNDSGKEEEQEASEIAAEGMDQSIPDENSVVELAEEAPTVLSDERQDPSVIPPPTKRRKAKSGRKTKKAGAGERSRRQETLRKQEVTFTNSLVLALSKVFGSPARIAFFSLVLFFWVSSGLS